MRTIACCGRSRNTSASPAICAIANTASASVVIASTGPRPLASCSAAPPDSGARYTPSSVPNHAPPSSIATTRHGGSRPAIVRAAPVVGSSATSVVAVAAYTAPSWTRSASGGSATLASRRAGPVHVRVHTAPSAAQYAAASSPANTATSPSAIKIGTAGGGGGVGAIGAGARAVHAASAIARSTGAREVVIDSDSEPDSDSDSDSNAGQLGAFAR